MQIYGQHMLTIWYITSVHQMRFFTYDLNHILRVNVLLCHSIRYVDNKLAYFASSLCSKGVNHIFKKKKLLQFVKAIYVLV